MAVRRKRSISIPPELDAEIAAAAQEAGISYSAWVAQTARKEFIIRAGLDAVSQYEAEYGRFTPDETAEADEWAARIIRSSDTRRTA
jgi:HicB family